jgi:hypothetical protein
LAKALELDRVKILDQKIRLGKANVKDVTTDEKKGTSLILSEFSMPLILDISRIDWLIYMY